MLTHANHVYSLLDVPLGVALPAAASALAYLNARWSLSYDVGLVGSLLKGIAKSRYAAWNGQLNLFYILEHHALASGTKDDPFLAPFAAGVEAGAGLVLVSSAR